MAKLLRVFFIMILTALAPLAVRASLSAQDLADYTQEAQKFLCQKGFCLKKIPPVVLADIGGYLGYVDRQLTRISISPQLTSVEAKLALVHELTHVYRAQFNNHEVLWLNEGLAKMMEYEYAQVWPASYNERLRRSGVIRLQSVDPTSGVAEPLYEPEGDGYMGAFFLTDYLYRHCGADAWLSKVMNSPRSGWDNVLSSIRELIAEGEARNEDLVDLPEDLVNQASLLRHFAISLWLNDPFAAQYSLFELDPNFQPLSQSSGDDPVQLSQPALNINTSAMEVAVSNFKMINVGKESWALESLNPIKLNQISSSSKAPVYFYLFYP